MKWNAAEIISLTSQANSIWSLAYKIDKAESLDEVKKLNSQLKEKAEILSSFASKIISDYES